MSWRDRRPVPQSEVTALLRRLTDAENRLRLLEQTKPTSVQLIDFEDYDDPAIGELHVNWPGVHRVARRYDPAIYFHDGKWRALGSNAAVYEIKVFEDDEANIVKDRAFVWEVPEDLDGAMVMKAGAFVTTAGGDQEIAITIDGGGSILDSNIIIPAGEKSSRAGVTPQAEYTVEWGGDQLSINTLAADGMGLGVWVLVVGAGVGGVVLEGLQGAPGQIGNPKGVFNAGTTYSPGDTVFVNGTTYVALQTTTGVTPGVTAGWETQWMQILEQTAANGVGMSAISNFALIPGIRGAQRMPFDGEFKEATLVADAAGSVVLDIWKTDYAGWPPDALDSITGGNPLTLVSANKTINTTFTGWDTTFNEGDFLVYNIVSNSLISRLNLDFKVART